MMKWMMLAVLSAVLATGCGKSIDAQCNACGAATYTADECNAAGSAAQCKTSVLSQSTDAVCNPTSAPTTHATCVFTACSKTPDCGL